MLSVRAWAGAYAPSKCPRGALAHARPSIAHAHAQQGNPCVRHHSTPPARIEREFLHRSAGAAATGLLALQLLTSGSVLCGPAAAMPIQQSLPMAPGATTATAASEIPCKIPHMSMPAAADAPHTSTGHMKYPASTTEGANYAGGQPWGVPYHSMAAGAAHTTSGAADHSSLLSMAALSGVPLDASEKAVAAAHATTLPVSAVVATQPPPPPPPLPPPPPPPRTATPRELANPLPSMEQPLRISFPASKDPAIREAQIEVSVEAVEEGGKGGEGRRKGEREERRNAGLS